METILETILVNSYKEEMIAFIKSNPDVFDEAMQLAIAEKQPYSWRAAWLLWSCLEENDRRVHKYIKDIINSLQTKQDGHQRELLKILSTQKLAEEYEGILFDICVDIWESINKKNSVRYIAFKFIVKIMKKYPDLAGEVSFLLQDQYLESLSPGVKHSISKIITKLNNQ